MKYLRKIKDDILYIGASDHRLSLFENLFPIPSGVSYNSYLILDEKTCVMDSADASVKESFLENLKTGLNGRALDYFVVHHLEPDHSAVLIDILKEYPDVTLVLNSKSYSMMKSFLNEPMEFNYQLLSEKESLKLGSHELVFVMAPMVHWPEVMVSYDIKDKILFSADAFGTFGALNGNIFNDELVIDDYFYSEARRYYTNIVGKFGVAVQGLLKKASGLDISMICPLHGPIWRNNFTDLIHRYDLWSKYQEEDNDIVIIYGSMYQHTYQACCELALRLADKGILNIALYDVSKVDVSYLISEIFRCKHILLACPTYNGGIYPKMHNLLTDMEALNVSNKNIGIIENGSWAPMAGKKMKEQLSTLKNVYFMESQLTIQTVLKDSNEEALNLFINEVVGLYYNNKK